jgi:alkylation response protein AidB-like acyl-CoA dehydrogenase
VIVRISVTEDQRLLGTAVRDLVARECTVDALRAAWDSGSGRVPGLWKRLADLGVLGLLVPERLGGGGAGAVELVVAMDGLGRQAVPEPVVPAVVGAVLLARAGRPDLAAEVASGGLVVGLQLPGSDLVLDAQPADLLLVAAGGKAYAVPAAEATVSAQPALDPAYRVGVVTWTPAAATELPGADLQDAYELAALATAAELLGLAGGILERTARYAGERVQFGRPIGAFQAVKHQLADVYVAAEFARPVLLAAAWTLDHDPAHGPRAVSHAFCACAAAAARAADVGLQVHGAIGYTFEHELHMWLKRVWSRTPLWGGPVSHLRRVRDSLAAR